MTYTIADVGPRVIDGVETPMSDEEKQQTVDEWNANEAAAAASISAAVAEKARAAALTALQDKALAQAIADPNAPQAVKDYAAVLAK